MSSRSAVSIAGMPRNWSFWAKRLKLAFERQCQPVADRKQRQRDAGILMQFVIEAAQRLCGGVPRLGVRDRARPQRVVHRDQPAAAQQRKRALVIVLVVLLVGIDEDEIERPLELRQRLERRREPQLDLVLDARLLPEAARERGPLGVDVAAQYAAIRGQRERDREGAVAGERADLQAASGADRLHEKRHELSLVGADLHSGMGIRRRGFAQLAQHSGFAHRVLDDVARQLFWKERMPARHQTRNSLYAGLRVSSAYG